MIFAAILLVAPEIYSSIVGLLLLVPVVVRHLSSVRQPQAV